MPTLKEAKMFVRYKASLKRVVYTKKQYIEEK
jgi:hypothetical protein